MSAVVQSRSEQRKLNPRSDPTSPWWHIDGLVILVPLLLTGLGLVMIYSATRGRDSENYLTAIVERQALFVGVGVALMVVTIIIDYRYFNNLAWAGYAANVLLLSAVLVPGVGQVRNGARAWFEVFGFSYQPSEVMKLGLIVMLAWFLSRQDEVLKLQSLSTALVLAGIPILLVLLQPDIGTIMVYVMITGAMLLMGGATIKHLLGVGLLGITGIVAAWPLMAAYAKGRLEGFIDPSGDAEATYNVKQAQIAIGNGGFSGKGFGQGTQTNSGLVPEQHTDFIFTVIGEEFGFVGGVITLSLFALLIFRIYRTAVLAGDRFGSLVSIGVLAMLVFQVFQSVGMTMGLMPVTGIPLPFVSQGGSSLLTSFIAMGLVINVHMRRFQAELSSRR